MNPFPQGINLASASSNIGNVQGGNQKAPTNQSYISMVKSYAFVSTRMKEYSIHESSLKNKEGFEPLVIEKPMVENMPHMLKGTYKRELHNPNARATPNYSIVDDLGQTPCAMLALEVLQSCCLNGMLCCQL